MKLSVKSLSALTSLQSIGLWNIYLHSESEIVNALASLPSLQSLTLVNCRTDCHSVASPPSTKMFKRPVLVSPELSFRELIKLKMLHPTHALVKLPITPGNLQEIDYHCTCAEWQHSWPVLPYPAPTLPQLRRLRVSLSRGIDLEAFFRDLSSIHSLIELVIREVRLKDTFTLQSLPKPHNHSQPILSELIALTCPVFLLQYFARCPLLTLDISPDCRAFGTRFPTVLTFPFQHSHLSMLLLSRTPC
jgi:hypothetical protein